MHVVTLVPLAVVALEHVYFLYVEMFAWTKPATLKAFGTTAAFAAESKAMAANQGLYNGFLAAGLVWAIVAPPLMQRPLAIFFTACVLIAATFGGATVSRRILVVQGLPAALALVSVVAFGI